MASLQTKNTMKPRQIFYGNIQMSSDTICFFSVDSYPIMSKIESRGYTDEETSSGRASAKDDGMEEAVVVAHAPVAQRKSFTTVIFLILHFDMFFCDKYQSSVRACSH